MMLGGVPVTHELLAYAIASVRSRIGSFGAIGAISDFLNDFVVFGAPVPAETASFGSEIGSVTKSLPLS
jgi:hypothetical protein